MISGASGSFRRVTVTDTMIKKIISKAVVWLPVFLFVAVAALLSESPDYKRASYPVETIGLATEHRNLEEVRRLPDQHWFMQKQHAFAPISLAEQEAWFRIKIPANNSSGGLETFVADVGFYVLKHVDFYLVENNQIIDSMVSGVEGKDEKNRDHGLYFDFRFSRNPQFEQDLYVRIASQVFMVAPVTLREEVSHNRFESLRNILMGLLLGTSIGVLIYNVVLYSVLRRKNYVYYAMFQAVVIAFACLGNGVASALWSGFYLTFEQLVRVEAQLILVAIISPALFVESFVSTRRGASKESNFSKVARISPIILLFSAPFLPIPLLIIGSVFFLFVTLTKYNNSSSIHFEFSSSRYFGFAIRGICAAGLISVACWLGLFPGSAIVDEMYIVGLIWAGLFLTMAIAVRVRDVHKGNEIVVTTLKNRGPKSRLNAVLRDTYRGQYRASELKVTIMFVDIVSFGQLAAALQPDEVLTKLSKRLDEITKIIHQFGGSVDRSLGDGILCFFGYGSAVQSNKHALDAFNAAVKIQQNTVDFSNKVGEDGSDKQENFPLPVRIGMHTDTVTIGNLGSDQAVDFTMVGSGVNFTSQLESACAPFKIMLSESCRQQLLLDGVDRDQFQSILFSLKNKVDLVNAYEVNPFAYDPTRMNLSVKMYRKQLGESSREDRFRVVGVPDIFLVSSSASFRVIDFSPRGFQVVSSAFLAQKSVVEVSIDTQNPELDLKLSEKLMRDLTVEVRWSRKNGREFLHGMRLLGGAESQWHFLMEVLVEAARGDKASLQPLNNEVPDDFPDDLDVA